MAFHRHFKQENIPDLNGRVAIVTGGSDGVGYYDALGLARPVRRSSCLTTHSWHGKQAEADINKVLVEDHSTGSVIWHGIDMSNLKSSMTSPDDPQRGAPPRSPNMQRRDRSGSVRHFH
ncbi:hypothetical protein A0H81_08246 [Grifola frondosa]|uniref:Uncharacterized protein n=1 Tax=Grifola frondosa TaxID=5627 RepID=A0A1C7M6B6_GRIFR|nr:hypothetical protein A0H81_08246 [Grifola frondosa]